VFEASTAAQANQVTAVGAGSVAKVALCRAIEVLAYQVAAAVLCQATVASVMIQRVVVAATVFVARGKCWNSERLSLK
jgi:hypothetical protein